MARASGTASDADLDRLARLCIFPGTRSDVTPEEMLDEVDRIEARLTAGDYDLIGDQDDD